ncbi:MAG: AsmA family protein [Gammaproteobacteria bacterium]
MRRDDAWSGEGAMRLLKIIGIIAGLLVGLLVLVVLAVNLIPANHYKDLISTAVKSTTGRDLVIGDLDVRLGSHLRIAASDVSFSNATWGSRAQMFTGRLLETDVALRPLLDGVLDLRLILEAPDMLLEKDAAGRANWQFGDGGSAEGIEEPESPEQSGGLSLRPLLREIRLEKVKLAYTDAQADQKHAAAFETVLLRSLAGQVDVKVDGRIADHPVVIAGGIDEAAVIDSTKPGDFSLTGKLGDIALNMEGTLDAISASPRADLRLAAEVPSLASLATFTGRQLPDQGPLKASLHLSGAEGSYRAEDIKIDLGAKLLAASVEGAVADLMAVEGVDLTVSAQTDQLAELVQQLGIEVPTELPPSVGIAGKVSGGRAKLTLSDYDVQVKDEGVEASLRGQVADLVALTGIEADLTLAAQSMAALSKYAGTDLPDAGKVELSGKLASPQGLAAPSELAATLSADGVIAKLDGSVDNLQTAEGIALTVDVKGDSLEQVAKLAGQHVPAKEPLTVKTKLSLGGTSYKADELHVGFGDNELTVRQNAAMCRPASRPSPPTPQATSRHR